MVHSTFGDVSNISMDAEWDNYIRSNAPAACRSVGGAAISATDTTYVIGVADPELRVRELQAYALLMNL